YKGTGPALTAMLAAEADLFFDNLGTSLQHVRSGRLKALAVCGEHRHLSLPDVPAMNEIYPGFVSVAWFGLVAPPRTSPALAERRGRPVIVENRPGAAGNIGADVVSRADPDGYTLLSAPPPPLVINKLLYPKLSYDSAQFVPITVIGAIPNVLLVHPKINVS